MEKAQIISKLIKEAGYSRRSFAEKIGLPPTTLQSMLSRGVGKASVDNVIKVCKGLGITTDELEKMTENKTDDITSLSKKENKHIQTIAAHLEGKNITDDKMNDVLNYIDFIFRDQFDK